MAALFLRQLLSGMCCPLGLAASLVMPNFNMVSTGHRIPLSGGIRTISKIDPTGRTIVAISGIGESNARKTGTIDTAYNRAGCVLLHAWCR